MFALIAMVLFLALIVVEIPFVKVLDFNKGIVTKSRKKVYSPPKPFAPNQI